MTENAKTEGQVAVEAVAEALNAPEVTSENVETGAIETGVLDLNTSFKVDLEPIKGMLEENKGLSKFIEGDKFNLTKALKTLTNAEKLIGKRIEDASPEQLTAFAEKLGIPLSEDGYEIAAPEDKAELIGAYKKLAKEAGIPKAAAEKFFNGLLDLNSAENVVAKEKARIEKNLADIKAIYGDSLDSVKAAANKAIEKYGSDEVKEILKKSDLATDPKFIGFLAKVGEKLVDVDVALEKSSNYGNVKEDIDKKISTLRNSPEYKAAMRNPYGNEYKKFSSELLELYSQKN